MVGDLPEPKRSVIRRARATKVDISGISDCTVVSVCLADGRDENCQAMNGVHTALLAACHMHLLCLSQGRPTRAGVDVGLATPLGGGEVYGPALERAVELEGRCAQWPRVAVGGEVARYLAVVAGQSATTFPGRAAQKLAERSQRLLFRDADGQVAPDFLGEEVRASQSEPVEGELVPRAYRFEEGEVDKWRKAGNTRLLGRYERLESYFEARAGLWGLDTPIERS